MFLFNLLARKLFVVSHVYFPILEVFCMPVELHYNLHLQSYGSYIYALTKGFPYYIVGHKVHISRSSRFSFYIYIDKFVLFRFQYCLIYMYWKVIPLLFLNFSF